MVMLCCFNNNLSYMFEFSTFAVFFKEYHGWNDAMLASFAQTAGDLTAGVMMKVFGAQTDDDEDAGVLRRLIKQPYSLACLLVGWSLCNLGMTSPWLPLAVTAQVLMGTVYVYTCKLTSDLNLFYSLGDQSVFLSLQVSSLDDRGCRAWKRKENRQVDTCPLAGLMASARRLALPA